MADYFEEENAQLRAPHVQLGGLGDDEFEATPKDIPLTPFSNESLFNDRVVSICEGSCDTN
ncbi:MAG: hypothetical protein HOI95_14805 [Chromatiales bacterium]|nr:hypothetical protein [Chromatiales bacterium]